ncbi:MAG: Crp/Fnr family transcriptional regulator [Acidobacteria bacterium]|nr:Crp/Fnr family transcriptional regulator [Acidobacteriota bacterium]
MSQNIDADAALRNHLLASIPLQDFQDISPALERVSLRAGQVLHSAGCSFEYVYFPTTALVALLYISGSGTTVGLGLIGSEGVVGIEIFMGVDSDPSLAVVQNAGIAYRMRPGDLRDKCAASPQCRDAALRYTNAMLTQVSQTAVCNRFHPVSQRYARWLLESADRLNTQRLAMTHEQIAGCLGTRRESITLAAHELSVLGIIKIRRGSVTILDRPGLESAACECYEVVSSEYDRLLGTEHGHLQRPDRSHYSFM